MRSGEIDDLISKWYGEESTLRCKASLEEFSFEMKCRVSSLSAGSFTVTSKHGDCSLTFRLDSPNTVFSYVEPRSISGAMGLSLTSEQELSSTVVALLHPESSPLDPSKPRDTVQFMELAGWE